MHYLLAAAMITFVLGMFIISYPMGKDPNYGGVWRNLTLVLAIIYFMLSQLPALPMIPPVVGLVQRAATFVVLLWTVLVT